MLQSPIPPDESGQLILIHSTRELAGVTPTFGAGFLAHHAGSIIADPRYAITELVANAWDAGATKVAVVWPAIQGERVSITDNGVGMTREEFITRWTQLNYDRIAEQGTTVHFPKGGARRHRKAFGCNGIGRHAMFCFGDEYTVDTRRDGQRTVARVLRAYGAAPYRIDLGEAGTASGHGTTIACESARWAIPVDDIAALLGSRFVSDPAFEITLNGSALSLTDLDGISDTYTIPVPNFGEIRIHRIDGDQRGRTSAQNGVAWWTNRRMVGMPSWEMPDGPLLDARTSVGKRITYIVEADILARYVKPDWSAYHGSETTNAVLRVASDFIRGDLQAVMHDVRKDRKRDALAANRGQILSLPPLSQEAVAHFVEEIQIQSPTISPKDLSNAVRVLATLEQSRSGYQLLERLAHLSPDALDGLNEILSEWSIADVKAVLGELRYRLRLIAQLESLVEKHTADELHDLQPLFERGLWIFGPEFESISFTSNRTLATVIADYFGKAVVSSPQRRPDFVVLQNSSVGAYGSDAFDKNHEVSGLAAVVIVELKRGGFVVAHGEKDQAMGYSRAIRESGKVSHATRITCYVLGTSVNPLAEDEQSEGATVVIPRTYQTVLRQAHARTFNLLEKIETSDAVRITDPELKAAIGPLEPLLGPSFEIQARAGGL